MTGVLNHPLIVTFDLLKVAGKYDKKNSPKSLTPLTTPSPIVMESGNWPSLKRNYYWRYTHFSLK